MPEGGLPPKEHEMAYTQFVLSLRSPSVQEQRKSCSLDGLGPEKEHNTAFSPHHLSSQETLMGGEDLSRRIIGKPGNHDK